MRRWRRLRMCADQAAGLHRRYASPAAVALFSAQAEAARRVARGIERAGRRVLLLDLGGRHLDANRTRALFDWPVQLARQRLQPIAANGIDVIRAAGACVGGREWLSAGAAYDVLLFDAGALGDEVPDLAAGTRAVIVDVAADDVCASYALIKTLHAQRRALAVLLGGDGAGCARVAAAAERFLAATHDPRPAVKIHALDDSDALLARIMPARGAPAETAAARSERGEQDFENG